MLIGPARRPGAPLTTRRNTRSKCYTPLQVADGRPPSPYAIGAFIANLNKGGSPGQAAADPNYTAAHADGHDSADIARPLMREGAAAARHSARVAQRSDRVRLKELAVGSGCAASRGTLLSPLRLTPRKSRSACCADCKLCATLKRNYASRLTPLKHRTTPPTLEGTEFTPVHFP